ncbi:MAG: hypothetical protein CMI18_01655 [Opitutaceae bacterium]|nr:hypothetical protein [Opitutaceae bacterium]|tara:strand:- start:7281 stop:8255 length:975 start_codon:yes stop_codon:yes gene_type:complete
MKYLLSLLLSQFALTLASHDHMVTIQNNELSVTVAKHGAELQSIKHIKTDIEYLWQGDPEYWEKRSPNMFPVNVRFKDNRFSYKGKEYEMPRMGLAVNGAFEVHEQTGKKRDDAKLVLSLKSSKETLKYYPFPFELRVISQLKGLKLHQKYRVTNTGNETMPFALGGHPGFRAPFIKRRYRSDYQYTFSEKLHVRRNVISDSLIQDEQVDFLNKEDRLSLSDDRIPIGGMLLMDPEARVIGLALKRRNPYVTLDLRDFPNVNLWSPPGRPYLAIEPMVAHHDLAESPLAIEKKDYLIRLEPEETRAYTYTIMIDSKEGKRALGE